jgi:hypothetical protein
MSVFRDSVRIFSHLSLYRVWNLVLLKTSFYISRFTNRSIHLGLPSALSIEPTTSCNLGCPECPSGLKQFTRPTGKLDLQLHDQMIRQIKSSVFLYQLLFSRRTVFTSPIFRIDCSCKKIKDLYLNLNKWSFHHGQKKQMKL